MKRQGLFITGLVILILVLMGSWAVAAEKTGFVDIREVMLSSSSGKKVAEEFKKTREKLQREDNELKKLKDDLDKQRPLLKEDVVKERELAFQKKVRDFQIEVKDSEDEFKAKEQELFKKLIPDILKTVQAIGEKEKYGMIIDLSAIPLAYYAKENDLTKRVIEEFSKTSKSKK
jgi:outer membrane protein